MTDASAAPSPPRVISRLGIAGIALATYVAACLAPALHFDKTTGVHQAMPGYEAALLGWQALFVGNVGWVANPIFALAVLLVLLGQWDASFVSSGIAFVLSLDSLRLLGRTLNADEGGVTHMVMTRVDVGFYLWTASMALLLLGSFWWRRRARLATSR